jgi:PAS domain S-box-containing protein
MLPLQAKFYADIAEPQSFAGLFEYLPDVFFLVKDAEGRFIASNTAARERMRAGSERDFVGTTDTEYVPSELLKAFRSDDLRVMRTGKPLVNRLEAWLDEQGQLRWFLTTKLPIKGRTGKAIGIMMIIRQHSEKRAHHMTKEVADAVAYLRANLGSVSTAHDLAKAVGTSKRTFQRKIQQTLGITPYELMLRVRIEAAASALVSSHATLSEIALSHCFCDQSAFTRHFRLRTGVTPRQFRLRHQM